MKFSSTQTRHGDLELWLGVKNDDKRAFGELFKQVLGALVNFAGIIFLIVLKGKKCCRKFLWNYLLKG
jgi:hypothetical protein